MLKLHWADCLAGRRLVTSPHAGLRPIHTKRVYVRRATDVDALDLATPSTFHE